MSESAATGTSGIETAFADAYRACHRSVFRTAFLVAGDASLAEEAVAEATVRVYAAWRRGRVEDLEPYLRRAVVNELVGRARRRAVADRPHPVAPAPPLRFEDAVADLDRLARALAALVPRQRAAIVLRYLHDLSEAQTAEALGVRVGSVKSAVSRGLVRLRAELGVEDGDDT